MPKTIYKVRKTLYITSELLEDINDSEKGNNENERIINRLRKNLGYKRKLLEGKYLMAKATQLIKEAEQEEQEQQYEKQRRESELAKLKHIKQKLNQKQITRLKQQYVYENPDYDVQTRQQNVDAVKEMLKEPIYQEYKDIDPEAIVLRMEQEIQNEED